MAAIRIKQNRFGVWSGYVGVAMVRRFYSETEARGWMVDKVTEQMNAIPRNETCGRKGFTFRYTSKPK